MVATAVVHAFSVAVGAAVGGSLPTGAINGAIVVGRQMGSRLPERAIRTGAAVAFFVFGIVLLVEGLRS